MSTRQARWTVAAAVAVSAVVGDGYGTSSMVVDPASGSAPPLLFPDTSERQSGVLGFHALEYATNTAYRLDTEAAQAFLGEFFPLP